MCLLGVIVKQRVDSHDLGVMPEGRMYSLCCFKIQFTHFVKSGIYICIFTLGLSFTGVESLSTVST